ncbi:MAG: bifunctional hydroxymethylpyrimidine kinase/phosphomethylpyrimidine kinase [Candidatus Egerieousia sp.]|nr:bifunctional hydroxymethylpyrimidine kinase/phosphomethylpyrimidine kinase [bacterium]MDY5255746.1 bifunctional hydroxymethylpyrimidine kinase/phosphomethylpyrimidine kinase [Candidatus Egerieousia sp.]
MNNKVTILTITGSDSTGGSGVQADIKSITSLGGYAASAITAVVVQDTGGIEHLYDIPAEILDAQLQRVAMDLRPDSVKIGLLRSVEQVETVAALLRKLPCRCVVMDFVIVSTSGARLMEPEVVRAAVRHLFPLCTLVMMRRGNALELLRLCRALPGNPGFPPAEGAFCKNSLADGAHSKHSPAEGAHSKHFPAEGALCKNSLAEVATAIMQLEAGPQALFLKGEEVSSDAYTDLFLSREAFTEAEPSSATLAEGAVAAGNLKFFSRMGAIERALHGSAGAFTSALAFYLTKAPSAVVAVERSLAYVNQLILRSVDFKLGKGGALLDHGNRPIPGNISARKLEIYNTLMDTIATESSARNNVEYYSGRLSITPRYLSQITKAISGRTPKELIDDYLIKEVETQLLSGELSLKQIASKYGFSSQAQLSKFVQKMCSCSPSEYKQLHIL